MITDLESTADLQSSTDLESTAGMYLENTHAFKLSTDVASDTLSFVEKATEATGDYNPADTESFLSEDYADVTAAYSQELMTGAADKPSTSMGSKEPVSVLV